MGGPPSLLSLEIQFAEFTTPGTCESVCFLFLCLFYMRFYEIKCPSSFLYIRTGSSVLNPHPTAACGELAIPLLPSFFISPALLCSAFMAYHFIFFHSFCSIQIICVDGFLHFFRKLFLHSSGDGIIMLNVSFFFFILLLLLWLFQLQAFQFFHSVLCCGTCFLFPFFCCKTIIPMWGLVFLSKTLRVSLVFLRVFCLFKKNC